MSWFSSNNLNKFNYDFYNSISNFKSNNNKNNKKFNSVRNSNNNLNFILKHTKKNSIFNFNSTNNKKLDSNHFLTIYNVRNKNLESRNKKTLIIKQPTSTILPTIKIENNNNFSIKKLPFIKIKSTTNRENKKFLLFNNNNNIKTNENKKKSKK